MIFRRFEKAMNRAMESRTTRLNTTPCFEEDVDLEHEDDVVEEALVLVVDRCAEPGIVRPETELSNCAQPG